MGANSNNHLVLIVEDSEDIARLVQLTLQQLEVMTHHSDNGLKAWEYLQSNAPDLIVLDIGMPGMSGWELLEIIKKEDRLRDVRILVTTAFSDPANRVVGKLQDVDDYIVKPYRPDDLLDAVSRLLNIAV